MKNIKISGIALVLVAFICSAAEADVELVRVIVLGHYPLELHTRDGAFIEQSPVTEYKTLEYWNYHDGSSKPKKFDAVAIIHNPSSSSVGPVSVEFNLSAKVGPFDAKENELDHRFIRRLGTKAADSVADKDSISVVLSDVDLEDIWMSFWSNGEWPYQLEVSGSISCEDCSITGAVVRSYSWTMQPGD